MSGNYWQIVLASRRWHRYVRHKNFVVIIYVFPQFSLHIKNLRQRKWVRQKSLQNLTVNQWNNTIKLCILLYFNSVQKTVKKVLSHNQTSRQWDMLSGNDRSSDCTVTAFRTQLKTLLFVWLSDYVVTVELLPDSALVALRRFLCYINGRNNNNNNNNDNSVNYWGKFIVYNKWQRTHISHCQEQWGRQVAPVSNTFHNRRHNSSCQHRWMQNQMCWLDLQPIVSLQRNW